MSRDMIKLQLSRHLSRVKNILSRDMSFMPRRSDIITLYNVCSVHQGMFSTSGGCSVHWEVLSTLGGCHEYIGGCSVRRGDIMMHVGEYHDACGGYHDACGEIP